MVLLLPKNRANLFLLLKFRYYHFVALVLIPSYCFPPSLPSPHPNSISKVLAVALFYLCTIGGALVASSGTGLHGVLFRSFGYSIWVVMVVVKLMTSLSNLYFFSNKILQ